LACSASSQLPGTSSDGLALGTAELVVVELVPLPGVTLLSLLAQAVNPSANIVAIMTTLFRRTIASLLASQWFMPTRRGNEHARFARTLGSS
jgi:hypothetical protein